MSRWVRVKSEGELRAGMAVQLRPCSWCKREETFVIVDNGQSDDSPGFDCDGNVSLVPSPSFRTAGRCTAASRYRQSFDLAIPNGRLYRLIDSEPATSDAETTRDCEVVRVNS